MEKKELLGLGFKDTSFLNLEDYFREFTIEKGIVKIQVSGIDLVEIAIDNNWIDLPNCKKIDDLKQLVKLFI